ncbi:hypothetical protein Asulf_01839 [Archaeoglobus sulfaticallidus PM70-1]|uniref:Tubulin-like CetZ C-terminal domain-containing protein n=1 Tax=Archaeoglobus sulfaticallidus PM70-1 TaxID=387631 RepID=N0BFJ8_9EURY|nr:hypothetical protein [Archaeoglobus sulfaticallidus]AGK61808.1 hypothetical protein Asulf_01839 [Archaeoglobus sulfaticallidus PM70-1]
MRLLTIGIGKKGASISDMLHAKGARVNKVNLFKTYAVCGESSQLGSLKLPADNRFLAWQDDPEAARSILTAIFSKHEFYEAFMIVSHIDDEYGFDLTVKIGEELMSLSDDPVINLLLIPPLDTISDYHELRKRLKIISNSSKFVLLFEEKDGYQEMILNSLNMLSLVGEIDLKKKIAGEVVVDTSDVFNSFMKGLSAIGYAEEPVNRSFLERVSFLRRFAKKEDHAKKTEKMVNIMKKAINDNLSARCDISSAKTALLLFGGDPEDITMDGMFTSLQMIDKVVSGVELRYGDYPVPHSKYLKAMVLFSGMSGLKF